jgi:HlyD family secretion protein
VHRQGKAVKRAALIALALLLGCDKARDEGWQGYVEGEYVLLASPYAGQLQKLHVRRGDAVEAGKPVFVLEQEAERAARSEAEERLKNAQARAQNLGEGRRPAELDALRAELRQAQAALELSQANLAREVMLLKTDATSRARYDEARGAVERDKGRVAAADAQLRSAVQPHGRDAERKGADAEVAAARAAVAQAAWRLDQKSVAAPRAGLVQDTFFVEGEWVPAGRPVASLLPPGNVKIRFYVPETVIGGLQTGKSVEVRCDGCPAPIAAKISFISSQAEYTPPVLYSKESRGKLLFLVEARPEPAEGTKLRPGQPVDVGLKGP